MKIINDLEFILILNGEAVLQTRCVVIRYGIAETNNLQVNLLEADIDTLACGPKII